MTVFLYLATMTSTPGHGYADTVAICILIRDIKSKRVTPGFGLREDWIGEFVGNGRNNVRPPTHPLGISLHPIAATGCNNSRRREYD